jgi:hypothetical protein
VIEQNYSIEEILTAVKDLQNMKKEKNFKNKDSVNKKNNSIIPKDTLKLIEDAEKSKMK